MSYKITIEETQDVVRRIGRRWEKLGEEEVQRDTRWTTPERPTILVAKMGYTPETESTVTETVEIYHQVIEDLDIKAVIRAVNQMGNA